ncbi:hypothetical protein GCM10009789_48550 [Kribbella sancticallisti]|uniref:Uncharacterized protein n=1 Tax=Kribbella sancticallisti TaxID=460087 RepID=A0ABN2DYE1_9ACTN
MSDLILEGDPELLEELRKQIEADLGAEARLEPVTSTAAGEFREPLLIGLILALGGPAVVKGIVAIVDRVLTNRERMAELRFKVLEGDQERSITLQELRKMF